MGAAGIPRLMDPEFQLLRRDLVPQRLRPGSDRPQVAPARVHDAALDFVRPPHRRPSRPFRAARGQAPFPLPLRSQLVFGPQEPPRHGRGVSPVRPRRVRRRAGRKGPERRHQRGRFRRARSGGTGPAGHRPADRDAFARRDLPTPSGLRLLCVAPSRRGFRPGRGRVHGAGQTRDLHRLVRDRGIRQCSERVPGEIRGDHDHAEPRTVQQGPGLG